MPVRDVRHLGHRLQDARLVIRRLKRHEPHRRPPRRALDRACHGRRVDATRRLGLDPFDGHASIRQVQRDLQHGRVLDAARDEGALSVGERVREREVVGLGAARGEHHVARVHPRERGHRVARGLDERARAASGAVNRGWIRPGLLGRVAHGRKDIGVWRRRRVPIEVDGRAGPPLHVGSAQRPSPLGPARDSPRSSGARGATAR
jgi:hypothetical protein